MSVEEGSEVSLRRLEDALKRWYPDQYPVTPAPPLAIASLRRTCLKTLGVSLPHGYLQLLASIDGFIFNGLTVFAAKPRVLAGGRPVNLGGFVEENEGIRLDQPHFSELLVFGYNDLDHFVYHVSNGNFLVLSRVGEDVFDTFTTFDELIVHAFKRADMK